MAPLFNDLSFLKSVIASKDYLENEKPPIAVFLLARWRIVSTNLYEDLGRDDEKPIPIADLLTHLDDLSKRCYSNQLSDDIRDKFLEAFYQGILEAGPESKKRKVDGGGGGSTSSPLVIPGATREAEPADTVVAEALQGLGLRNQLLCSAILIVPCKAYVKKVLDALARSGGGDCGGSGGGVGGSGGGDLPE